MSGYHHTAQICLNGHVLTSSHKPAPGHEQKFCPRCGEAAVTRCESCQAEIRGRYEVPGVIDYTNTYATPGFCHSCGKPYPWTERRLQAAKELADELDELSETERLTLRNSLEDLIRDTPRTELAGIRFKKMMKKVGKEPYEAMRNMVTDLLSESLKRTLFGL